jgi:hypothetical protein
MKTMWFKTTSNPGDLKGGCMNYDPATLTDFRYYTQAEVCALVQIAKEMGLPLEAGSWMEQLTIAQLEMLVNGRYQA